MGALQYRRRVVLTWRQWLAIPFMIGLPALALAGVFGPSRAGAALHMAFRERITQDDIESAAHLAGLTDVSQVRLAILEGNGEIAVIPVSRESEHITQQ